MPITITPEEREKLKSIIGFALEESEEYYKGFAGATMMLFLLYTKAKRGYDAATPEERTKMASFFDQAESFGAEDSVWKQVGQVYLSLMAVCDEQWEIIEPFAKNPDPAFKKKLHDKMKEMEDGETEGGW